MSVAVTGSAIGANEQTLADRILSAASKLGSVGITRDELLRKLGVSYGDLMAALDELSARGSVRVEWPTPESFRVFSSR